jgi:hypothetical protein
MMTHSNLLISQKKCDLSLDSKLQGIPALPSYAPVAVAQDKVRASAILANLSKFITVTNSGNSDGISAYKSKITRI